MFYKSFAKFIGQLLCRSLFLINLLYGALQLYLKRDSSTGVFLWILSNFEESPFLRKPQATCLKERFAYKERFCLNNKESGKCNNLGNTYTLSAKWPLEKSLMHVNNVLALNTFRSSIPVSKTVYSTVVDAIVAKAVYSTAETQKQRCS